MKAAHCLDPRFLVLTGDGINCAKETAWAFSLAGAEVEILHINDLLNAPDRLLDFHGLAFPGGFSFGDDLGAGQVMALKIRQYMWVELQAFLERQSPMIGICNGFQILSKLGLLPTGKLKEASVGRMALAPNVNGTFINRWVGLQRPTHAVCKWTEGISEIALPIRHAEGRVVFEAQLQRPDRAEAQYQRLWAQGQIALQYQSDINGSYARIAGLTDPSGLILGLMPHPEAYLSPVHHPTHSTEGTLGLQLFQNIVRYCRDIESRKPHQ